MVTTTDATAFDDQTTFALGRWQIRPASGELVDEQGVTRLEPKVLELLLLLLARPGQVISRDEIVTRLWAGTVVGDDTVARTVSKLRKALGDDGKAQAYVETLSKRGYRLIMPVAVVTPVTTTEPSSPAVVAPQSDSGLAIPVPTNSESVIPESVVPAAAASEPAVTKLPTPARRWWFAMAALLAVAIGSYLGSWRTDTPAENEVAAQETANRANDFYAQYSRPGNESAITLFEQLIASKPDYAPGYAGLANALVQKVVRWQQPPTDGTPDFTSLGAAIRSGHTRTDTALALLNRAQQLAELASQLAPDNAECWKALGFVYSAQEKFELALATYQRAVALDNNAWGALINMGDVLEITGRASEALSYFEAAHAAMTRVYDQQAVRIQPWYAALGVLIGDRYQARGDPSRAEQWYRRVLDYAPLHAPATGRMALLRWQAGDVAGAQALCAELAQRIGNNDHCRLPGD